MVQVAVTIAPVQAATRNARRMGITLFNASLLGEIISMTKEGPAGLAAANREYVIGPNVGLSFLLAFDGPDIKNEWGAYATANTAILVVGETSERDGI